MLIVIALYNYLPRLTCGNEIKCCYEPICVGAFGTDSFLARPRRNMFPADFVVKKVEGTYSGSVFSGVFFGVGWLPGLGGIEKDPWSSSWDLAFGKLECCLGAYPVDSSASWTSPEYWDADDIALGMSEHLNIWTDGCGEGFSSLGGFEVAGAGVFFTCFCACF